VLQLQQLEAQLHSKLSQLTDLKQNIRFLESASDAQQAEIEINTLSSEVASLTQSISSLQSQIRSAFFDSSDITLIERVCRPSVLAGLVPVEFRVVDLREEDYTELVGALLAQQRALAEGVELDTDSQLIISRFQNLPAVVSARSNLLYNLDAVRAAFYD